MSIPYNPDDLGSFLSARYQDVLGAPPREEAPRGTAAERFYAPFGGFDAFDPRRTDFTRMDPFAPGFLGSFGEDSFTTKATDLIGDAFIRGRRSAFERAEEQEKAKQQAQATRRPAGAVATSTGAGDPATGAWRPLIEEAARENGIDDPDIIQAIMMIESQGNAGARSPAGAMGLMQVMPFHFGPGEDGMDPRTNVMKGAKILADNYRRWGSWDKAAAAYLGAIDANGNITGAADAHGTTGNAYVQRFNENLARLKAAGARQAAGGRTTAPGFAALWGGGAAPVTQEFGHTEFSQGAGAPIYEYGAQFGHSGHTGLDIGLADGSKVYTPVGGTVVYSGGTGYYKDEAGRDPARSGEFRLRLDDGSELIIGHMGELDPSLVGRRVEAGQYIGLSGTANGPHIHVEYRVRDASTPSGWRIVDPRTAPWAQGATGGGGHNH